MQPKWVRLMSEFMARWIKVNRSLELSFEFLNDELK